MGYGYLLILLNAALCSVNIYLGIAFGNALNWAAAAFIGILTIFQIALVIKDR